ncbi:MAG: dUTP diphosphatase [Alphaproteobacteria bacterium]
MKSLSVAVRRLAHGADLRLPGYATEASAGMDLSAAIEREVVLAPGARASIPTGLEIALPEGCEAQIRPRSGLALEHGLTVLNAPGTIDADYRGEIAVILANLGDGDFTVRRGMRIAQLVVAPVGRVDWREVDALPASERGDDGFGSTGLDERTA